MIQAATLNTGPHHEPASSTSIGLHLPGKSTIALDGEPIVSPPQRTQGSLAALRLYSPPQRHERLEGAHPIDAHSGAGRPMSDQAMPGGNQSALRPGQGE